jgi:hypothetical protein
MNGLTVGTTAGSLIPGVGTVIGGTLGGLYDTFSDLFGSHKDPFAGDMKRLNDWLIANNITDQTIINEGVAGVQAYSDTGDSYWKWWEQFRNKYKNSGGSSNAFTIDKNLNTGLNLNSIDLTSPVVLLAIGGIVLYFATR